MRFLNKIKNFWPILFLLVVEAILFSKNYVPGTYFLGWDNLFPELNITENIKRSFFAIWEEYRGLGFLDGMSFAANLPYYIFVYISSFIVPQSLIRYISIFLLHLTGGIGMFYFLCYLFKDKAYVKTISFIGAFFYLFNFATVQMFYAPYELFAIHFAFLPWLILYSIKYLKTGQKKNLLIFSILSLISASQAHVPTVFIAYLIMLFAVVVSYGIQNGKLGIKRALIILLFTVLLNSFWGLPYAYFGLTSKQAAVNSKINQMSTESTYLNNKARGNFTDVALMRGFWLDYTDTQNDNKYNYIMPEWRNFSQTTPFMIIGFFFFTLSLIGIILTIAKKETDFYPFIFSFAFSFLMLGIDIPILRLPFDLFSKYIPTFAQIFRFTFTKFSILYAFSFTILLSFSLSILFYYLKKHKYAIASVFILFLLALLYYTYPSFNGKFIYGNLRVKIPNDYFKLVDYFKKQNSNTRIALLPQNSYWGWTYTSWGYRGSGFIWYGLPQASMDGSTFPWNRENENYFWELDQAVSSNSKEQFEAILEKYQINWLIVDNSLFSQYSLKASQTMRLHELIAKSKKIQRVKSFGAIDVYATKLALKQKSFISIASNLPNIGPKYAWGDKDQGYLENGNYVTTLENQIFYPFRTLFTGKNQEQLEFKIKDNGNYFSFQAQIPTHLASGNLIIPGINLDEVSDLGTTKSKEQLPKIFLDGELINLEIKATDRFNSSTPNLTKMFLPYVHKGELEIQIPKTQGLYSYNSQNNNDLFNRSYKSCNPFSAGTSKEEKVVRSGKNLLRLSAFNSTQCFDFDLPYNQQRLAYLITVKSKYVEGKSLLFSVINKALEKPSFESNLPKNKNISSSYFIIPPLEESSVGYDLYFYNVSLGNVQSINEMENVEVNTIPYSFFTSLKIEKNLNITNTNAFNNFVVSHPNQSLYIVNFKNSSPSSNTTLLLSQSFDSGWKAYSAPSSSFLTSLFPFVFGQEVKNHVMINNWENGWKLGNVKDNNIIIVYLPQYLEYLGYCLTILALIYIVFSFAIDSRKID